MHLKQKNRRHKPDPRQPDFLGLFDGNAELIDAPTVPQAEAGGLVFDRKMRNLLNRAIAASPLSREQIADGVSVLAGRLVTKAQIDSWTGASRPHRFPADLIPAFCQALGNTLLLSGLAEASGCRIVEGEELKLARLGQLWLFIDAARTEQRRLVGELPLFAGRRE